MSVYFCLDSVFEILAGRGEEDFNSIISYLSEPPDLHATATVKIP